MIKVILMFVFFLVLLGFNNVVYVDIIEMDFLCIYIGIGYG